MTDTPARWEPIPGYEKQAAISDEGQVFSYVVDALVPPYGYKGVQYVRLWHEGPRIVVGRTVLTVFAGPKGPGWRARHINGLWYDNRLANLQWVTVSEMARIAASKVTRTKGIVLEPEVRERIRKLLARPKPPSFAELAAMYGVSEKTIRRIGDGQ